MKWSVLDQFQVRRSEILRRYEVINNWDTDIKETNKDNFGESFHYPNTFRLLLGYAKVYFHLLYRQTKRRNCKRHVLEKVTFIPDCSTIR